MPGQQQPQPQLLQQSELVTDDERIQLCWHCGAHMHLLDPSDSCCSARPVALGFELLPDGTCRRRTPAQDLLP